MKHKRSAGFFCRSTALAGLGLLFCSTVLAEPVQVFTDRKNPVQLDGFAGLQVIYLDEVERLEAALSEGLSSNPEQAEKQALALLHSAKGQQLQRELLDAYAGLAQAWSLGITHIPAVAKGGHVVYGETDIARAVRIIEAFKAGSRP